MEVPGWSLGNVITKLRLQSLQDGIDLTIIKRCILLKRLEINGKFDKVRHKNFHFISVMVKEIFLH